MKKMIIVLLASGVISSSWADKPCEEKFLKLIRLRDLTLKRASDSCSDEAQLVSNCYQADSVFLKEAAVLPADCTDSVTTANDELKNKLKDFSEIYQDETHKEFPDQMGKASVVVRDYTFSSIRERCDRRAQYLNQ